MNVRIGVVLATVVVMGVSGCSTTLRDVDKELRKAGFRLWYPAESGIEAGQIWITNGKQRIPIQRRPTSLPQFGPNRAIFTTTKRRVTANASLNAKFTSEQLGDMAGLSADLAAAGVRSVSVRFGNTEITRVVLDDLKNTNVTTHLPASYMADMEQVYDGTPGFVLIAGIVAASGMDYTFDCTNTVSLAGALEGISTNFTAKPRIDVSGSRTVTWHIPEAVKVTIGVMPLSGENIQVALANPQQATEQTLKSIALIAPRQIQRAALITHGDVKGYTVQGGESLSEIAQRYSISVEDIMSVNNIQDKAIAVGNKLLIPGMIDFDRQSPPERDK